MVTLTNFCKYYGSFKAVDSLSCRACDNEVTALVGLNGAGKTTVMNALCALHYADSGEILIDGVNPLLYPQKVKRMCGFVRENPSFYQGNLVIEELLLACSLAGIKKKEKEKKVRELVALFSLKDVLYKKVKNLSKGYKQRLSFACVMSKNPSVIVLDEPISGLDPVQIDVMHKLIKKLAKTKTIIISTHILQEVSILCDKVIILHEGTLRTEGTVSEICAAENVSTFEEAFLSCIK